MALTRYPPLSEGAATGASTMSATLDSTREQIAAQTLAALTDCRAILANDHFVYISRRHGSGWIDSDAIFPHTDLLAMLCAHLAGFVGDLNPQVVCGPVTGGLIVAQGLARELKALAVFAEHDRTVGAMPGAFVLRRGFGALAAGKRVLVVDDVVNTGQSIRETVAAVRAAKGEVAGVAAIVSRGTETAESLRAPRFDFLLNYTIPSWPAAQCQLCRDGVPVNTHYAHGEEFVCAQRAPDE